MEPTYIALRDQRTSFEVFLFKEAHRRRAQLYGILDSARSPELLSKIAGHNRPFTPLFSGQNLANHFSKTPFIVSYQGRSRLLSWHINECWGENLGIFFTSQRGQEDIVEQLRVLLHPTVENQTDRVLFRFYDPRVFRPFMERCSRNQWLYLANIFESVIVEFHSEGALQYAFSQVDQSLERSFVDSEEFQLSLTQIEFFDDMSIERFAAAMVEHLRRFASLLAGTLEPDILEEAVRGFIGTAEELGFETIGGIRLFLEAIAVLGSGFYFDPQYPWAAQHIMDLKSRPERLVERGLYRDLTKIRKNVLESRWEILGLERAINITDATELDNVRDFSEFLSFLRDNFSERLHLVREESVFPLYENARQLWRVDDPGGSVVFLATLLMFVFGFDCLKDPFYPWIRRSFFHENRRLSYQSVQTKTIRRLQTYCRVAHESLRNN